MSNTKERLLVGLILGTVALGPAFATPFDGVLVIAQAPQTEQEKEKKPPQRPEPPQQRQVQPPPPPQQRQVQPPPQQRQVGHTAVDQNEPNSLWRSAGRESQIVPMSNSIGSYSL